MITTSIIMIATIMIIYRDKLLLDHIVERGDNPIDGNGGVTHTKDS